MGKLITSPVYLYSTIYYRYISAPCGLVACSALCSNYTVLNDIVKHLFSGIILKKIQNSTCITVSVLYNVLHREGKWFFSRTLR